jgi:serine/threonine protein kinase
MIAKGVAFGPYEILSQIGAGGMGEVWRARDHRLERDVAIKVLLSGEFRDEAAVERFAREARAAGSLNHPGLVTILDVGSTDGAPYIVMEMLEGITLREAMAARLPRRKVIDYAVQIASALAVAHERGIVHRDLKPENVFIASGQRVKILDFGLAKLVEDTRSVDPNRVTSRLLTGAGNVVGTPAYMSPEQVRADLLDARTDIFSFGAVLYEMLAGRPAFDGETAVDTLHKILHTDSAPLETIVPDVPRILAIIARRCLEKQPRERFQSASDLAFELDTLAQMQKGAAAAAPQKRRERTAIIALSLLLAAAVAGLAALAFRKHETPARARSYKQLTFNEGVESFPALAPDGKSFAYVSSQSGNRDIYVQRVDGRGAINVTGDSQDDDSEPAFSPDGAQIAFRSERDGGGIFVMGVTGESVRRLTNEGHNPSWSPDGTQIAVSSVAMELRPHVHLSRGSLSIVDTRSSAKRVLLDAQARGADGDALQPSWSPHGKRIAYWGVSSSGERFISTIDPQTRMVARVVSGRSIYWNPVWAPDGNTLFFGSDADGTLNLWRVGIDEATGAPRAAPEPLSLPAAISGNFSVSRENEITYCTVTRWFRLVAYSLDLARGNTGEPRVVVGGSEDILTFEPSPDGTTIAFTTGGGAQEDVFLANAADGRIRQLTNDVARDRGVTWSSGEKKIYFYSNRSGRYDIWSVDVDGGGLARVTDERDLKGNSANIYSPSVSPDGRTLAVQTSHANFFIHLDRPTGRRFESFANGTFAPNWSPDGTRLIGEAQFSSGRGIFVYSLPTRRVEMLLSHGSSPQWLPDGKRIAFFENDGIGILDLTSGRVTMNVVAPLSGGELNRTTPRLTIDGSTLYVRQTLEQGDVWMVRFGKE